MPESSISLRQFLVESHCLKALHLAFGEMLVRRAAVPPDGQDALLLLGAVTLAVSGESHSCLFLEEWCQLQLRQQQERLDTAAEHNRTPQPALTVPELATLLDGWRRECLALSNDAVADGTDVTAEDAQAIGAPLLKVTLADDRHAIYLNRYFQYEHIIAKSIRGMLAADDQTLIAPSELPALPEKIRASSRNFMGVSPEESRGDAQQQAVCNALQRPFAIVTGGPGRGKTTVLADILALALAAHPELTIALCAPTGKAAARMHQAILNAVDNDLQDVDDKTTSALRKLRAQTVHSLLGISPDSDYPRANREKPLDADLVAVDECSMMSLQLFAQLLTALKPGSRLLLLGDENQLASVDAGNVLAELCHCKMLSEIAGVPVVNRLLKNYRSRKNERLCDYSNQLVATEPRPDVEELFSGTAPAGQGLFLGVEILPGNAGRLQQEAVLRTALEQAGKAHGDCTLDWLKSPKDVEAALASLERFKILCPTREGDYGVVRFNTLMRKLLGKTESYANGVPVLITRNDTVTGLRNGDVGVCFGGQVYFPTGETGTRSCFAPAQLPPHECAYAMTIHKSQGSDYGTVLMALPPRDSQSLLTRELIYTGITRTKENCIILANRQVLELGQRRPSRRWSGLARLLE